MGDEGWESHVRRGYREYVSRVRVIQNRADMADVMVGAGVVGASVAFHLAERGAEVLVVDREGPSAGSTARSAAQVRTHYPPALEADLA